MPAWMKKLASGVGCLLVLAGLAVWLQPRNGAGADGGPIAHWVFDSERLPVAGGTVPSLVGDLPANLVGSPRFLTGGPTPALEFRSETDRAFVDGKALAKLGLPREALSIAAWVRPDRGEPLGGLGGLVCLFQNHFDAERGFLLGYETDRFVFGLAAESSATDRGGRMTFLRSKSRFTPGCWYHLVAAYDGQRMKLFVNGQLAGESTEQSGPIRFPGTHVPLTIGRYRNGDDPTGGYNNNEDDVPFLGAIREVALYGRALSENDVAAVFKPHRELAGAPAVAVPPYFVVPPYLQFPTTDSMTVMWETSVPGQSLVEYGTGTKLDQRAELKESTTLHEVRLSGLQPETKYVYRVSTTLADGTVLSSDLRTFQTAVKADSAFSFAVIGDTQKNPRMTGIVARQMWARRPNFVIHCGDVVDNGPNKAEWVDELFRPCGSLLGRVAIFPCIGNHEKNHAHFYKYFSLPKPENYYSYKYGNAEFFVIDSNKPLTPGSEQYTWLDRELGKSTATWKFAYHHHPAYSSDDNDYGNTWKGERSKYGDKNAQNLIALYERHRLDINFNGHIHVYERSWPVRAGKVDREQGVIYVTSGGGGAMLENFAPTPSWFKAQCRSDYHTCLLTIHGGRLEFKAFDSRGQLFDSLELKK